MNAFPTVLESGLLVLLTLSASGVLYLRNPVHACLAFLVTLLTISALYVQMQAPFLAVIQVMIYAGAILVIFMFAIVLFQDAHRSIGHYRTRVPAWAMYLTGGLFGAALLAMGLAFREISWKQATLPQQFGSLESIGRTLYWDYFFPFEIILLIFIVAIVGALYMGKKEN